MKSSFFIFFIAIWNIVCAEIGQWDIDNIKKELSSIPLQSFSKKNIYQKYKNEIKNFIAPTMCSLIEIKNNEIYVNEEKMTLELAQKKLKITGHYPEFLAYMLCSIALEKPLPNILFLYSFWSTNIDCHPNVLNNVPILIGIKEKKHTNTITFSEATFFSNPLLNKDSTKNISSNDPYLWEQKINKLYWRGQFSDSGWLISTTIDNNIEKIMTPRIALCCLSFQNPNIIDAKLTGLNRKCKKSMTILKNINFDLFKLAPYASLQEHILYKHQIVVDGFHCPNGYIWRLNSNCCVFKVDSNISQWFYEGLKPFIHYIPVKPDLSDLIEQLTWVLLNDSLAKKIAENGHLFAQKYLKKEDLIDHIIMVLNMYAKFQNKAEKLK